MGWKTRLAERGQDLEYQANKERVAATLSGQSDQMRTGRLNRAHEMGMLGAKNQFEAGQTDKTLGWKSNEGQLDRESQLKQIRTKGAIDQGIHDASNRTTLTANRESIAGRASEGAFDRENLIKNTRVKGVIDQGIHDATNRTNLQMNTADNTTKISVNDADNSTLSSIHGNKLREETRQFDATRGDNNMNLLTVPNPHNEGNPLARNDSLTAAKILRDRQAAMGMRGTDLNAAVAVKAHESQVAKASSMLSDKSLTAKQRREFYGGLPPEVRSSINIAGKRSSRPTTLAPAVRESGLLPKPVPMAGADPYELQKRKLMLGQ